MQLFQQIEGELNQLRADHAESEDCFAEFVMSLFDN
jgi:hypothetical protein